MSNSSNSNSSSGDEGDGPGPESAAQLRARDLFDRFTMGMVQTLEEYDHVVDIRSKPAVPATSRGIAAWENNYTSKLPGDLKDFYLSTDGLQIIWIVLLGRQVLPLGWLQINALSALKPLKASPSSSQSGPGLSATSSSGTASVTRKLPPGVEEFLKSTSVADDTLTIKRRRYMPYKAFSLAPCGPHATVALAFTHPTPSIWLVDRSRTWHMIARTFTEYYRLMTLYLGLPEWQYALTSLGPLPDTRRWLHAFVPAHVLLDNAQPADATQTSEIEAYSDSVGSGSSGSTPARLNKGTDDTDEHVPGARPVCGGGSSERQGDDGINTSSQRDLAAKLSHLPSRARPQKRDTQSSSPPSLSSTADTTYTWASSTFTAARARSRHTGAAQHTRGGAATLPRRAATANTTARGHGDWGGDAARSGTNPWATATPGRRARGAERGGGEGAGRRGGSRIRNKSANNGRGDGRGKGSPSLRVSGSPPSPASPPPAHDTASPTPPVVSKINLDTVMRRVRGDSARRKPTAPATGSTSTSLQPPRTGRPKADRTTHAGPNKRPATSSRFH